MKGVEMENRRLGRTGVELPVIGLGGIPIGRLTVEEGIPVINAAFDAGIKFIDTARGYNSEQHFGAVLKERRDKDGIFVATKSPKTNADDMRKELETSLQQLQVEMIDLYQCHAVRDEDALKKVMSQGGALEALKKARDEGLIRFIGITSHRFEVLEKAIESGEFDTIMIQYSFIDYEAERRIIPLANEKDIGIIVMKAFAGGVIERSSPALKYVLRQPVSVVPVGMSSIEEVKDNIAVAEGTMQLTDEEKEYIEQTKRETEKVFCRRCGYCMPCPNGVPIPQVLSFSMIYKRIGWKDMFLNWMEKAEECAECEECLPKCPYELPIIELIKQKREEIREVARKLGKLD